MSAIATVDSSDELDLIDRDLFAEVDSVELGAYNVDELAQYCFKCHERVAEGIWSTIGFVHEPCANTLTTQDIKAYHLSLSQSSSKSIESSSDEEIDLKSGKHSKFDGDKVKGKSGAKQVYEIRKGIFVDDHQAKHIFSWIGSASRGKGDKFPKRMDPDEFVQLLNQVIDSKEMQAILSKSDAKHGLTSDFVVQLDKPLKYDRADPQKMRRGTYENVRVQLTLDDDGWFFHMYPVKVS